MIGYYSFVFLGIYLPSLSLFLGLAASSFLGYFLFKLVLGWLAADDSLKESSELEWYSWPIVLAVSIDALYSGPAKSAQALDWSLPEIIFSFFIGGAVVYCVGKLVVVVSLRHQEYFSISNVENVKRVQLALMYLEFSLLFYFFCLCTARFLIGLTVTTSFTLLFSLMTSGLLFLLLGKRFYQHLD